MITEQIYCVAFLHNSLGCEHDLLSDAECAVIFCSHIIHGKQTVSDPDLLSKYLMCSSTDTFFPFLIVI